MSGPVSSVASSRPNGVVPADPAAALASARPVGKTDTADEAIPAAVTPAVTPAAATLPAVEPPRAVDGVPPAPAVTVRPLPATADVAAALLAEDRTVLALARGTAPAPDEPGGVQLIAPRPSPEAAPPVVALPDLLVQPQADATQTPPATEGPKLGDVGIAGMLFPLVTEDSLRQSGLPPAVLGTMQIGFLAGGLVEAVRVGQGFLTQSEAERRAAEMQPSVQVSVTPSAEGGMVNISGRF